MKKSSPLCFSVFGNNGVYGFFDLLGLLDDFVGTVFFHLTGRSVAPAAANGVQIAGVGAVDVGVAVADHHGLVPRCSIKTDFVEAVPNHLILVQTRVIPGCAIDAVQQLGQMEMLRCRSERIGTGLAAGQRQIIKPSARSLSSCSRIPGNTTFTKRPGTLLPGSFGSSNTARPRIVAADGDRPAAHPAHGCVAAIR